MWYKSGPWSSGPLVQNTMQVSVLFISLQLASLAYATAEEGAAIRRMLVRHVDLMLEPLFAAANKTYVAHDRPKVAQWIAGQIRVLHSESQIAGIASTDMHWLFYRRLRELCIVTECHLGGDVHFDKLLAEFGAM